MSTAAPEPTIRDRIDERPSFDAGEVRHTGRRDLLIRFVAGGLTSACSGAATLAFGARVGGVLLAFPAILAASLTLIEKQEHSVDAREDARGAIVGGIALALFALTATLILGHLPGALALLIGTGAWLGAALAIYLTVWWR